MGRLLQDGRGEAELDAPLPGAHIDAGMVRGAVVHKDGVFLFGGQR